MPVPSLCSPSLETQAQPRRRPPRHKREALPLSGGEEGWPSGDLECQFPGLSFCPLPSCDESPSKGVRRMLSVPWSSPQDTRPQTPPRASRSAPPRYSLLQRCRLGMHSGHPSHTLLALQGLLFLF